jgi:hypothetical protein
MSLAEASLSKRDIYDEWYRYGLPRKEAWNVKFWGIAAWTRPLLIGQRLRLNPASRRVAFFGAVCEAKRHRGRACGS